MVGLVWKYKIEFEFPTIHQIPAGGKVLSFQEQHNELQLWVLVNPDMKLETREFYCFATGEPIEDVEQFDYIGTIQLGEESFVVHLFERKRPISSKRETVKPYGAS